MCCINHIEELILWYPLTRYMLCFYVLLTEQITLTVSSRQITILQGDSISMSCIPSNLEIAIQWMFNGMEIADSSNYQLTPNVLNHYLTIPVLDVSDNGTYTCAVDIRDRVEETITLIIVPSEYLFV